MIKNINIDLNKMIEVLTGKKIKNVNFYAKRTDEGVVLNEVTCCDDGVYKETITLKMGFDGIKADYDIEKVV